MTSILIGSYDWDFRPRAQQSASDRPLNLRSSLRILCILENRFRRKKRWLIIIRWSVEDTFAKRFAAVTVKFLIPFCKAVRCRCDSLNTLSMDNGQWMAYLIETGLRIILKKCSSLGTKATIERADEKHESERNILAYNAQKNAPAATRSHG